jgi:hypothetical protein
VIKVFVWEHTRSGNWGHASLSVGDPHSTGTYVSWWPDYKNNAPRTYMVDKNKDPKLAKILKDVVGTDNIYKTRAKSFSYLHDRNEDGTPAVKITIADNVLDEEKIKIWWADYNGSKHSYHTIKKNCSTTVIRALRAGGSDKYVSVIHRDNFGLSKYTGWEPNHIVNYLREMEGNLAKGKITFEETNRSVAIEKSNGQGGVEMCEEHGYPLATCPDC